ncbi:DUF6069 family protein [Haladaptatus sp. DJG-WS-42]|uniref:DUF6069 family protein n=1 Tax=Haladaptatus sp. DJG-WS-42 TaxID=3120516 RepID=UPI0030CC46EA
MASTTATPPVRTRLTMSNLVQRGALALVVSFVAVAIVRGLVGAFLSVPTEFNPLAWGEMLTVTASAALVATLVYGLLDRFTKKVARNFLAVAALVFIFFLFPLFTVVPTLPGSTTTLTVVAFVLHAIVAVAIIASLLRGRALLRM